MLLHLCNDDLLKKVHIIIVHLPIELIKYQVFFPPPSFFFLVVDFFYVE